MAIWIRSQDRSFLKEVNTLFEISCFVSPVLCDLNFEIR